MGEWKCTMEGLVMDQEFWRNKRVLVTGHTGFKGSWLVLWLQSLGAHVSGYSVDVPTNPSLFEAAHVENGMRSHLGDVRDLDSLCRIMEDEKPEVVFHLAAQPLVRYSYKNPVETYGTNVMGTVHVLESVRLAKSVRAVIVVTSDKSYENREWVWGYRESDPMGGVDPYSSSKGCAELVTAAYRRSFFDASHAVNREIGIASVRAGNVIGGGDWAEDRLIPDSIRAFQAGHPVVIRNPLAIRPWQHVLEPLSGYLALAQNLYQDPARWSESWNFGPHDQDARPVEWLVSRICDLWGNGAAWELDGQAHPHEAHYLKLDISKAMLQLGWKPRWSLDQALQYTVAWYRAWQTGADVRKIVWSQIETFSKEPVRT
jgi:CDP-glucose 4,6-dehydratase